MKNRPPVAFEMFRVHIRNSVVRLFGLASKLGIERLPMFDRSFFTVYAMYKRYFEAGPVDRLKEFVPSGSLVIDVGANVGFFSLYFADWVGANGKVISIEPEDRNYRNLVSALERKGLLDRVRSIKAAAADVSGKMFLEINPLHPADHKLSRDGTGLVVDAVTLDELVKENGSLSLSFVKIDVQGAELKVLQGASNILKTSRPALFIELHEEGLRKFGTSVFEILNHLSQYNYDAYLLVKDGAHKRANAESIRAEVAKIGYVDALFLKATSGDLMS